MTIEHSYDHWLSALDGETVDWPMNYAMPGFFRRQERTGDWTGIAIWLDNDGRPVVKNGKAGQHRLVSNADEAAFCEHVFSRCSKHPVTEDDYRAWYSTGKWYDDVPDAVLSNTDGAPHEVVAETIADIKRQAEEWLAGIGGEITTQQQADTAANYRDRFAELAKEAATKRKAEKEPILKAGRDCDGRWNPVEDAGKAAKEWAARLGEAFLKADRAKKLAEAAKAAAAGVPVRVEDVKARAGTRGRSTTLKTRKEYRCTDYAAQFAYWSDKPAFRDHLLVVEACGKLSKAALEAGVEVPGCALVTVEFAS